MHTAQVREPEKMFGKGSCGDFRLLSGQSSGITGGGNKCRDEMRAIGQRDEMRRDEMKGVIAKGVDCRCSCWRLEMNVELLYSWQIAICPIVKERNGSCSRGIIAFIHFIFTPIRRS